MNHKRLSPLHIAILTGLISLVGCQDDNPSQAVDMNVRDMLMPRDMSTVQDMPVTTPDLMQMPDLPTPDKDAPADVEMDSPVPDMPVDMDMPADMAEPIPLSTACTFEGADPDEVVAFPGAEGFGRHATGGRGGRVLKVINTDNSGPGSLRWALEDESGPRIVVFEVEGTLSITDEIEISSGDVTIAGQTAPGDGFTVRGSRIWVTDDNVIIRGMRMRPGDGPGPDGTQRDSISVGTKDRVVSDVIVDHNSLTWAVDETFTAWYESRRITLSYNIIAEALHDSIHVDDGPNSSGMPEPHSTAVLLGEDTSKISVLSNLFANNQERHPLARGTEIEFHNNYIYNYGNQASFFASGSPTSAHILNNNYISGPQSRTDRNPLLIERGDEVQCYANGNLATPQRPSLSQPQSDMIERGASTDSMVFTPSRHALRPASELLDHLSSHVGARTTSIDAIDTRIIAQTRNETGVRIDSQNEVGGYLSSSGTPAPMDSDDDGIPDMYEEMFGFDPNIDDASNDLDGDGYTNIEEYINSLIPCPHAPVEPISMGTGTIEAEAMQLSGYTRVNDAAASGGAWVQTQDMGTATMTFDGPTGTYRITAMYFDENDGNATMIASKNNTQLDSWIWDDDLGEPIANTTTRTTHVIGPVSLSPGDTLSFTGTADDNEPARFDAILIDPM